jgi:hypothetical protein
MSLRMKIALAGLAGVAAAWLLPRGGVTPAPTPTASPSDRPGVTAVQLSLASIPQGVSFRTIDGVRVFLVRTGGSVKGFVGLTTTNPSRPIYWCQKNDLFEDEGRQVFYNSKGEIARYSSRRGLDQLRVLVSNQQVTVFPHAMMPGPAATFPADFAPPLPAPPPPCLPSERVG